MLEEVQNPNPEFRRENSETFPDIYDIYDFKPISRSHQWQNPKAGEIPTLLPTEHHSMQPQLLLYCHEHQLYHATLLTHNERLGNINVNLHMEVTGKYYTDYSMHNSECDIQKLSVNKNS